MAEQQAAEEKEERNKREQNLGHCSENLPESFKRA
jgi:hypothetical protein